LGSYDHNSWYREEAEDQVSFGVSFRNGLIPSDSTDRTTTVRLICQKDTPSSSPDIRYVRSEVDSSCTYFCLVFKNSFCLILFIFPLHPDSIEIRSSWAVCFSASRPDLTPSDLPAKQLRDESLPLHSKSHMKSEFYILNHFVHFVIVVINLEYFGHISIFLRCGILFCCFYFSPL
jgi:hypothetical protein